MESRALTKTLNLHFSQIFSVKSLVVLFHLMDFSQGCVGEGYGAFVVDVFSVF